MTRRIAGRTQLPAAASSFFKCMRSRLLKGGGVVESPHFLRGRRRCPTWRMRMDGLWCYCCLIVIVIHKSELEEWYEDVAQAMKGRAMLQRSTWRSWPRVLATKNS